MIGVDATVLVRYLVRDDEEQTARAKSVMEGFTVDEPGFIPMVVLLETAWLLRRTYKVPREDVLATVEALVASDLIHVQDESVVAEALATARMHGCDLPDALLVAQARHAGCARTVTFDRRAVGLPGMEVV
ncbi:MAG: type II toxin-antitoxin system VapC family toxin [Propionibacteriaceae bacterium]|nr:type II toxin-antitoxin system VapC family toxin [Propionibacteriaceae bacterium]